MRYAQGEQAKAYEGRERKRSNQCQLAIVTETVPGGLGHEGSKVDSLNFLRACVKQPYDQSSELDPFLRPDPSLKRMLHLSHLGNEIGGFD